MTQANDLLTLTEPQMEVTFFIDEDINETSSDSINSITTEPDGKKNRKISASRRRDTSKKKPYTRL